MIRLLRRLFARRPDTGLQIEAARFGHTLTQPGVYSFDKAVEGKRRAEQRAARKQRAEAGPKRRRQPAKPTTLRAVK